MSARRQKPPAAAPSTVLCRWMSPLATCPLDDGGGVQTHGSSPASAGSGINNITVRRGLLQYDKYLACKSVNVP
ncbi:hypothetical protein T01_3367 [Trichinella spiralis]|uniref:Uncharacterized protein n=1 Tax=Trichinella spiralis TaxID=6334 RepID=A0A0V1BMC4_TRISP|nr:hypothetical protein T01_3367 [Trichinella spiralis]